MGNLNMLKERNPQACLTKDCYARCHTRWRGLESHLLVESHSPVESVLGLDEQVLLYLTSSHVSEH